MEIQRPDSPDYVGGFTFCKVPLVLDPNELSGADVAIVGAPMDEMVTNRPGTRFGPRAIRMAYEGGGAPGTWNMDLGVDPFAELSIVDHGDAEVVPGDARANHEAIRRIVGGVARAGAIPIVLGGDHSISFPNVAGVAEHYEPGSVGIVHFDTHADTATQNWGVEWSHGTPFRNLVEQNVIRGNRLVQIGLRGGWPTPEIWDWMRSVGIRWHRMEEIIERGIDAVVNDALAEIADAPNVYVSVDIDVLDPAFAPGTGTPEPGGMATRELLRAVRRVVLERGMVGMDVVEVSPPYDHAGITAQAAHRVVMEALGALAVHRNGGSPTPERP